MKANNRSQRLSGIDLFRGIAAYAVVIVHSGDESLVVTITQTAAYLRSISYFCVPFFIATSFYLILAKPQIDTSIESWRNRSNRILIPYATWTVIYLIFRSIFFVKSQQMSRFWELFGDPLAIVCFGSASYQLYYLPLIFTATCSIWLAKYLRQQRASQLVIGTLAVISIIAYQWVLVSGNAFQLYPHLAFKNFSQMIGWDINSLPPLRLAIVQIAWLLNCLPYLLIGMLLVPLCQQIPKWSARSKSIAICSCLMIFCVTSAAIFIGIPTIAKDLIQAYCLLVIALVISTQMADNLAIASVGACSFGIYLIHPFVMPLVKEFVATIWPDLMNDVSIASLLTISILTFTLSWIAIAVMRNNPWFARYALGERAKIAISNERR